jgi:DNA-binding MarR family transcriptional regulator
VLHVDLGLLAIADRLRQHWTAHAARHGLTSAQVKALLSLDEQEPVAMRELAAKLDYDASNLTNVIERLWP